MTTTHGLNSETVETLSGSVEVYWNEIEAEKVLKKKWAINSRKFANFLINIRDRRRDTFDWHDRV